MKLRALDNPAWHALSTLQQDLSLGLGDAARFRSDVSPFAALKNSGGFCDLETVVRADEMVGLLSPLDDRFDLAGGWYIEAEIPITQMICEEPVIEGIESVGELLKPQDESDMLELARGTDPGPFEIHTREMGNYYGVRNQAGVLVAMAGERLRLPGWTEISGVCTSQQARGKGYARSLVARLMRDSFEKGDKPFLHVRKGSPSETSANAIYERLGFRAHQSVVVRILRRL